MRMQTIDNYSTYSTNISHHSSHYQTLSRSSSHYTTLPLDHYHTRKTPTTTPSSTASIAFLNNANSDRPEKKSPTLFESITRISSNCEEHKKEHIEATKRQHQQQFFLEIAQVMLPSLGNSIAKFATPNMATEDHAYKTVSHLDHSQQLPSIVELVPELFGRSPSKSFDFSYHNNHRRTGSEPKEYKGRCHESKQPFYETFNSFSFNLKSKRRRLSMDEEENQEKKCHDKLEFRGRESHSSTAARNRYPYVTTVSTPDPSPYSRRSSTLSSCETWTESSRETCFSKSFNPLSLNRKSPSLKSTICQSRSESSSASAGGSPRDSDTSMTSRREYQRSVDSNSLSSSWESPSTSYAHTSQEFYPESNDPARRMRSEARYLPRLPSLNLVNPAPGSSCTSISDNEYSLDSSAMAQASRSRQSAKSDLQSLYLAPVYPGNHSYSYSESSPTVSPSSSAQSNHSSPFAIEYSGGSRDHGATNNFLSDPFSSSPCRFNSDSTLKAKPRKRRGNLPKETTDKLRAWFFSHLSHPYPTEDEKQQLMDATGLQMNQISNWYINARRRQLPAMAASARAEVEARRISQFTIEVGPKQG